MRSTTTFRSLESWQATFLASLPRELRVEVPGIEPGSFATEVGLLRA